MVIAVALVGNYKGSEIFKISSNALCRTHYGNPDFWDVWVQICVDDILKLDRGPLGLWRLKYTMTWEAVVSRKNTGFGVEQVCRLKLSSATAVYSFF